MSSASARSFSCTLRWSCAAFFPGATATGYTCLGFAWEAGVISPLSTLGGNNGFAAGPGYDLASGVGTVDARYFVGELASAVGR